FKALAGGVLLCRRLKDEAEVLLETAMNGFIEREVEHAFCSLARDDAAAEGTLVCLRTVLTGGGVKLLLRACDGRAFSRGAGAAGRRVRGLCFARCGEQAKDNCQRDAPGQKCWLALPHIVDVTCIVC